jgi:HPt (histidine-containing phosphotransfer) domain-containing protein
MSDSQTSASSLFPIADDEVFNFAEALQRVEEDEELLNEMALLFLEECPGMLLTVQQALSEGDALALQHAAHTLKGSVGNFSAQRAFAAALTLETIGRHGDLSGAPEAYTRLEQELVRLSFALEALRTRAAA